MFPSTTYTMLGTITPQIRRVVRVGKGEGREKDCIQFLIMSLSNILVNKMIKVALAISIRGKNFLEMKVEINLFESHSRM